MLPNSVDTWKFVEPIEVDIEVVESMPSVDFEIPCRRNAGGSILSVKNYTTTVISSSEKRNEIIVSWHYVGRKRPTRSRRIL